MRWTVTKDGSMWLVRYFREADLIGEEWLSGKPSKHHLEVMAKAYATGATWV